MTLDRLSVPSTPQSTNAVESPTDPQKTSGSIPRMNRFMVSSFALPAVISLTGRLSQRATSERLRSDA